MMKSFISRLAAVSVISAIAMFAVACATQEPVRAPEAIHVGNSIVGYALATRVIERRGWTIDGFDASGITIQRATVRQSIVGDVLISTDIVFFVSPDGILDVRLTNSRGTHGQVAPGTGDARHIRIFREGIMLDLAELRMSIPDTVMTDLALGNETPEVLNNFLGNFQYLAAFMNTLTQVGRSSFIELITGRAYNWSWPLAGVTENGNPAFDRRFVARFHAQNMNLGGIVTLNVFTDDAALQMIPRNQNTAFSGTLISVEGNTFNLLHE